MPSIRLHCSPPGCRWWKISLVTGVGARRTGRPAAFRRLLTTWPSDEAFGCNSGGAAVTSIDFEVAELQQGVDRHVLPRVDRDFGFDELLESPRFDLEHGGFWRR